VGGLKNDVEGMMSNGKKVGYTGRKKGGKKEWTHTHTHARARTHTHTHTHTRARTYKYRNTIKVQ